MRGNLMAHELHRLAMRPGTVRGRVVGNFMCTSDKATLPVAASRLACAFALILGTLIGPAGIAATDRDPVHLVREMVTRIFDEIAHLQATRKDMSDFEMQFAAADEIERALEPMLAHDMIASSVLAPAWDELDSEDKRQFQRAFGEFLAHDVADALTGSGELQVDYDATRFSRSGKVAKVRSTISSAFMPIAEDVDYYLIREGADWRIFDFRFGGISLIKIHRATLLSTLEQAGFNSLIADLEERTAELTD